MSDTKSNPVEFDGVGSRADSGAFEMRARHPRLWKGWRSLITYYGISRREAEVKAAQDHRCYEGVVTWKVVRARERSRQSEITRNGAPTSGDSPLAECFCGGKGWVMLVGMGDANRRVPCPDCNAQGLPVCGTCGQRMRYNVPRLGPNGGFVHAHTGRLDCGGDNSPVQQSAVPRQSTK